jgi:murein DD-endopeptidase MepM/ murein hydrolase activator NlpD
VRALPWLVGASALAYAWSRRRRATKQPAEVTSLSGRWVWPVARWNGRAPVISDGFGSPRPGGVKHAGIDLMFARQTADAFKSGTPNGTAHHVMPDGQQAIAASDGVVWTATMTPRGYAVVLDHGKVATFYTHLEQLLVKGGAQVRAGQPIGVIGFDPLDAAHLKHLHFELWAGGPKDAIDPAPLMRTWEVLGDTALVARNASLVYHPVGASGKPYPDWVRALKNKAGVYVIRDRTSREIVYVGSSAGTLYDTLTRHFQTVRHEAQEAPMT